MKQLCTEPEHFLASVAVSVDKLRLPVKPFDAFGLRRKLRFELERAERLLDPECGLGRSARRYAERNNSLPVQGRRRQVLQPGDASAEVAADLGACSVIAQRQVPELPDVTSTGQVKLVGAARDLGHL